VLAARLGVPPDQVKLDRTCPDCDRPHGRPRLVSDSGWGATAGGGIGPGQLAFSISHSGEFVGAAFATAPAVGLDVELVVPARAEGLVDAVLSAAEHEDFDRTDPDRRGSDFFRYWVRKEAVVKATGDGLRVPLRDLTVSAADQPPRLVEWTGRPGVAAQFALYDLDGAAGHAASLAVIGGPVVVQEYDAGALIRQPVPD
jgi:4'-phosphopantetheinyl transferase